MTRKKPPPQPLYDAIDAETGNLRYCNRCGCPRDPGAGKCPECGAAEYSVVPNVTYQGWLDRQEKPT